MGAGLVYKMSMVCRFGDEEEWEEVPCAYASETDSILCRQPLRRRRDLVGCKVNVTVIDGEGISVKKDVMMDINKELKQIAPNESTTEESNIRYNLDSFSENGNRILFYFLQFISS